MKRTLLAIALAAAAATAFAAGEANGNRNGAGEPDQHQPQVGAIQGSTMVASNDGYRSNAGESTNGNVVQTQLG